MAHLINRNMKKLNQFSFVNLCVAILFFYGMDVQAQKTIKALFIGNSYTGVNNLPHTVSLMASSMGDSLIYDAYTPGGYTLQMHSADATTLSKIAQGGWDYVILQAQSQEPSFSPAQVAANTLPYAQFLDSLINLADTCTETVFYMTWGRKNGDASNCVVYPPVCTYAGMQQRLRDSYLLMAQQNQATVAPVGCVWRDVRATNPSFDLYQADESHPSVWGTYLAACTFYNILFQKSPVGSTYYSTLPVADAQLIQQVTASDVADSLITWCGNGNIPFAGFNFIQTGNTVQFNNSSLNGMAFEWNFGNGITDTSANPVYTYNQNGAYMVTLTVTNKCKSNVTTDTLTVTSVGLIEMDEFEISVTKIYGSNDFMVNGLPNGTDYLIAIYDLNGRQIASAIVNSQSNRVSINNHKGMLLYKLSAGKTELKNGKIGF